MNITNLTPKSYIFSEKWQKTYKQKHLVSEFSFKKKKSQQTTISRPAVRSVYIQSRLLYLLFGNCKIVTLRHKKDCKTLYVRNVDYSA